MPQKREVKLDYDQVTGKFGPTPKSIKVKGLDTIVFKVRAGASADRKLKITIKDHQHFPAEGLERTGIQELLVLVGDGFSNKTTYKCEFFEADGTLIASVDGETGGDIEPDVSTGPN